MPTFLKIDDFVRSFGVCKSRVYELLAEGQIEGVKIGRSTRITGESAEAWRAKLPAYRAKFSAPSTERGQ
jgi:excisionase family DNA binding protein